MKPIDYSNTIMYKIVPKNLNSNLVYVGYTTNFRIRKSHHKQSCNCITDKAYNYNVYVMIRDNGGWNEWEMIEIEKYPCNDSNEAKTRERYWYEFYNANLNSRLPICSQKEYREKNKDAIKQMNINWRNQNKDKLNEIHKRYREKNRDAIRLRYTEYQREYRAKKKLEKEETI